MSSRAIVSIGCIMSLSACQSLVSVNNAEPFYGTLDPFAAESVYFVMTDRFVDGDTRNNFPHQGGSFPTFDLPLVSEDGRQANVGYLGGDFQGILNNRQYISDMGFTAVWISPVMDNPNQAFSGGEPITFGGSFKDGGKTGYHGYWASNFYQADEHWVSDSLDFAQFTQQMKSSGLKTVLDIVANHGSPSFSMPIDQPLFGEIYDQQGTLVADHQNLPPEKLDSSNPLHAFYRHEPDILQLSNLNDASPEVRDYLINAYLYWIEQGADAFRIDTIKHVPHAFWKEMSDRIRAQYPDFFMFGESYDYDANFIAQHTLAENGGISVLDFPGQAAISSVFSNPDSDFSALQAYLHLTHGPYANPYDLTTFYDNHDMPRMNASDNGFIDAHNWLFTSRGIPVVYMGSESGFMRGTAEHTGNRNYFGQQGIEQAKKHIIHANLSQIANVRKHTPALQRGLQLNVDLAGHQAVFYRVLQYQEQNQIALVLLNKSAQKAAFAVSEFMQGGSWTEAITGEKQTVSTELTTTLPPHSVQVWVLNEPVRNEAMKSELRQLMREK